MVRESQIQGPRSRIGRVAGGLAGLVTWVSGWLLLASPVRAEVFLRANQVGYGANDTKVAVAFSGSPLPDTFVVLGADDGASVFEGKTALLAGERWGKFDHHAELDFTGLTRPGRYVLRLGDARSLPFAIGDRAWPTCPTSCWSSCASSGVATTHGCA